MDKPGIAGVSSGTRICCTSRADFTSSSIRACRSRSRNCSRAMVKIKARNNSVLRITKSYAEEIATDVKSETLQAMRPRSNA